MLGIYGFHHIPTGLNAKGHRACRTNTGFFMGRNEARRIHREGGALVHRRLHLAWLVKQWKRHMARCQFVKESYL